MVDRVIRGGNSMVETTLASATQATVAQGWAIIRRLQILAIALLDVGQVSGVKYLDFRLS